MMIRELFEKRTAEKFKPPPQKKTQNKKLRLMNQTQKTLYGSRFFLGGFGTL